MSQSAGATNGASLEDCHTNFFALTDLCGIKWGRYSSKDARSGLDWHADAILNAYAKCLETDILCVWRRAPGCPRSPSPPLVEQKKELWLFWYGEQTDIVGIVGKDLIDEEQGSWENGLTYECRSLMFKALHNRIERLLLSRGFVRLAKWLVQPMDEDQYPPQSTGFHLPIAFSFFVHGESTVCASLDVRRHPPVFWLNRRHLETAGCSSNGVPVILAPFGLAGTLENAILPEEERDSQKLWDEWNRYYPLEALTSHRCCTLPGSSGCSCFSGSCANCMCCGDKWSRDSTGSSSNSKDELIAVCVCSKEQQKKTGVPLMVPVVVGGVRMLYPAVYVLVVEDESSGCDVGRLEWKRPRHRKLPILQHHPLKRRTQLQPVPIRTAKHWPRFSNMAPLESIAMTDASLMKGLMFPASDIPPALCEVPKDEVGLWDFTDTLITNKSLCSCGPVKSDPDKRRWKSVKPFHRRSPRSDKVSNLMNMMESHARRQKTLKAVNSLESVKPGVQMQAMSPVYSLDSVPDPAAAGVTMASNLCFNPQMPQGVCEADNFKMKFENVAVDSNESQDLINSQPFQTSNVKEERAESWRPGGSKSEDSEARPILLPRLEMSDHEKLAIVERQQSTFQASLYDFTSISAWVSMPVSDGVAKLSLLDDLFDCKPVLECVDSGWQQQEMLLLNEAVSKLQSDPYEFDEQRTGSCQLQNKPPTDEEVVVKIEPGTQPSENKQNNLKSTPFSMYSDKDLVPTLDDLDQLFAEEDREDDMHDATVVDVPTPPGSNKPEEEGKLVPNRPILTNVPANNPTPPSGHIFSSCNHAELCSMFPTPPSHEPLQPMQSPCPESTVGLYGIPSLECDLNLVKTEHEEDSFMDTSESHLSPLQSSAPAAVNNPFSQFISDLSPVFEPSAADSFSGSSKYTALSLMPSQANPLPDFLKDLVYTPAGNQPPEVSSFADSDATSDVQPSPQVAVEQSPGQELVCAEPSTSCIPVAGNALLANLILTDSCLNVFSDHNFESCSLCVCSEAPDTVGNIKGLDGNMYLSDRALRHLQQDFDSLEASRCSCGFSAVVNRRKAYRTGLFYEDEAEITGIRSDCPLGSPSLSEWLGDEKRVLDEVPEPLLRILRAHSLSLGCYSVSLFAKVGLLHREVNGAGRKTVNLLEYLDHADVANSALDETLACRRDPFSRLMDISDEINMRRSGLHSWPFVFPKARTTSQEVMRAMRVLQPLLQEAIQKKKNVGARDTTYQVSGPLTWRQFHRMAGRGTEDQCEPQPIPYLVVGHEKDWLTLSPLSIGCWENLVLEPFGRPRDVAYIVVTPDEDFVVSRVLQFFKELSCTYKMCKLGRHSPITRNVRDGVIRVGKKEAVKPLNDSLDDWFNALGDTALAANLRLYAQVCRNFIGPYLAQQSFDSSLLDVGNECQKGNYENMQLGPQSTSPVSMPPPPTPESSDAMPPTPRSCGEEEREEKVTPGGFSLPGVETEEDEDQPPALVIYLIDPFTYACQEPELYKLISLGLLRCFHMIQSALAEAKHDMRENIFLQVVPLETIVLMMDHGIGGFQEEDGGLPTLSPSWVRAASALPNFKSLAFSVFSQCRMMLNHTQTVKSLTGFGPAASADTFLKAVTKEVGKMVSPYPMLNPSYVLAAVKDKQWQTAESVMSSCGGKNDMMNSVLYVTYCLSEDQRWLLACATDEKGELLESEVINIHVPNRANRRHFVARRIGLEKLMGFALGIISASVCTWRLVFGRLGRIGHSELKSWASLLSKKALVRWRKRLRELCAQCACLSTEAPGIASACLVSLEPDAVNRVLPDQFTPDERFGQGSGGNHLSTPQDVSCTHMLVFPTSAMTRSSQVTFHDQHINPMEEDFGDDDFFNQLNQEEFGDIANFFDWDNDNQGVGDMLTSGTGPGSPSGSPKLSFSSNDVDDGQFSVGFGLGGGGPAENRQGAEDIMQKNAPTHSLMAEPGEELGSVLQQPLALGYLVSTAPAGPLPSWFWSQCPHLEDQTPTFLTAALHLHSYVDPNANSGQQTDDFLLAQAPQGSTQSSRQHPLDSDKTTDVLRYVLEGYNALSWLSLDPARSDRRSCLPIHMQVLANMYNIMAALG
ncbi:unnamed protein product [Notodromas monacha]|uniref:Mediator of RNA polymerase II transcription subunit 13 n=1 Tax=Notodromas monacha TaxID=399045 RepID=A0A7R9BG63_9CRUS|nr:unnamed protein product [Notodromas monacha]CAG0914144.1 unnamed protein product [Notodromas monacha]